MAAINGELELTVTNACEDFLFACFGFDLLFILLGVAVHVSAPGMVAGMLWVLLLIHALRIHIGRLVKLVTSYTRLMRRVFYLLPFVPNVGIFPHSYRV